MNKIVFVSSEVAPFAKTGGLADVSGALPKALIDLGMNVKVIMPLYKCVLKSGFKLKRLARQVRFKHIGAMEPFDLYESSEAGFDAYFIENRRYFERDELYGTGKGDYSDSAVRFGFFSKAALCTVKTLGFKCDCLHLNDWQTALVPFYLKNRLTGDEFFKDMKTLYTIHNMAYQGLFHKSVLRKLDIPGKYFNMNELEFYQKVNFMKAGIIYSDAVSTVSKGYSREILTKEYGCGLEGVLATRKEALYGITNGVDYSEWNPEIDKFIKERYGIRTLDRKAADKEDLIGILGLGMSWDKPLFGVVTRLAEQKGIDLIAEIAEELVEMGAGLVILGKGDDKYQTLLQGLAAKHPKNVSLLLKFDNALAHKIEAGADIFLMPSRYEPCGLNQMYSLKYGTIPVVRATGGLDDVIIDYDDDRARGNGFKFNTASSRELMAAVQRCLAVYEDRQAWRSLMARVMGESHSWAASAAEYVALYQRIISGHAKDTSGR